MIANAPLAVVLAVVITCAPSRIDAIILRGLIVGMVACAVYDAFRLTAVYALGWMGDFIPTMGSWVTGDPDGTGNALVGYVWRYVGDGGGLGVCFFIVAFALGMDRLGRPATVVLAATGYAVFPVRAGLIGTVALAPRGQELMFYLTASSVTITLIGHLIFGVVLGLGFLRLRGVWEPGTWPFPPLFHQLVQSSGPQHVALVDDLRSPALPLVARHVEIHAQRPPHIARIDALLDGLGGGPAPQCAQHVVGQHRRPIRSTESACDEFVEFRQPHQLQIMPTRRG